MQATYFDFYDKIYMYIVKNIFFQITEKRYNSLSQYCICIFIVVVEKEAICIKHLKFC